MNRKIGLKHPFIKWVKSRLMPQGIELEMLRYRPNKVSYWLSLFGIVCMVVAFSITYSSIKIPLYSSFNMLGITNAGLATTLDILLNILLMLFLFLGASRMEGYSKLYGIVSLCGGIFELVRPFLYTLSLVNAHSGNEETGFNGDQVLATNLFPIILAFYVVSGALLVVAGFVSIYQGITLRKYLATVKPIENERIKQ